MVNINIQKKDLWLLSIIMVFFVGVTYIIAYNPAGTGGTPSVMGHSADEVEGVGFGDWTNQDNLGNVFLGNTLGSMNNQYQAMGDGFLVVKASGTNARVRVHMQFKGQGSWIIVSDTNVGGNLQSSTIPIGKDDIFYISTDQSAVTYEIYWKPLGASQLVKINMPIQTMYVSISLTKRAVFRTWYTVDSTTTVKLTDASGQPVGGTIVYATWGGGYGGSVSGITNVNGQVYFGTEWVARGALVTFTVNRINMGGLDQNLDGTLSASISI